MAAPRNRTTDPKTSGGAAAPGEKIGRGSPPKHSQFSPGTSGNPRGRPKGSKNITTLLEEAARDQVTATIDGKPRKISKAQATAMQLATQAAKGEPRAVSKFLDWMDEIEQRAAASRPSEFPFTEADLEVMRAVYERMKRCEPQEDRQ